MISSFCFNTPFPKNKNMDFIFFSLHRKKIKTVFSNEIHEVLIIILKPPRFTINSAHFMPVKSTHKAANIAEIYMKEIARLHGVPKAIVSNRDSKFTSNFWKGLFKEFKTNLNLGTTYHPQTDGQT